MAEVLVCMNCNAVAIDPDHVWVGAVKIKCPHCGEWGLIRDWKTIAELQAENQKLRDEVERLKRNNKVMHETNCKLSIENDTLQSDSGKPDLLRAYMMGLSRGEKLDDVYRTASRCRDIALSQKGKLTYGWLATKIAWLIKEEFGLGGTGDEG